MISSTLALSRTSALRDQVVRDIRSPASPWNGGLRHFSCVGPESPLLCVAQMELLSTRDRKWQLEKWTPYHWQRVSMMVWIPGAPFHAAPSGHSSASEKTCCNCRQLKRVTRKLDN